MRADLTDSAMIRLDAALQVPSGLTPGRVGLHIEDMENLMIAPLSASELERRWELARAIMARDALDALIIQCSNDWLGGYVRWFTGCPANNAYPRTVIFFEGRGMTVVEQGPFGGHQTSLPKTAEWYGISEHRTTPSYVSAHYTAEYDARIAIDCLVSGRARRVGLVAPAAAYHGFGKALEALAVDMTLIDVTNSIDQVKAIKSEEEWRAIETTATLQDEVMEQVRRFIQPGLRDFEIAAFAQYEAQRRGSEQGIFLSSSAPPLRAAVFRPPHLRGRTTEPGDSFALLIETNGPSGFYTEIARMFVLGTATRSQREAVVRAVAAQRHTVTMLLPGTSASSIAAEHDRYMDGEDLPRETRLYAHGQGHDMVERPLIRFDETMTVETDMNIVVHPGYVTDEVNALICDNFRVGPETVRLHQTPQDILETG